MYLVGVTCQNKGGGKKERERERERERESKEGLNLVTKEFIEVTLTTLLDALEGMELTH